MAKQREIKLFFGARREVPLRELRARREQEGGWKFFAFNACKKFSRIAARAPGKNFIINGLHTDACVVRGAEELLEHGANRVSVHLPDTASDAHPYATPVELAEAFFRELKIIFWNDPRLIVTPTDAVLPALKNLRDEMKPGLKGPYFRSKF